MMLFHVVCLCFLAVGYADQKNYHFIHIEGSARIHQDIYHDEEANTVTVNVGDVSMYPGHIMTVSYHDFDTKYGVFKDIRRGICMLTPTPVPEATPQLYALGETNFTLAFDGELSRNVLTTNDVEVIAGPRIASFCNDYETHPLKLTPTPEDNIVRRTVAAMSNEEMHCGGCLVSMVDTPFNSRVDTPFNSRVEVEKSGSSKHEEVDLDFLG